MRRQPVVTANVLCFITEIATENSGELTIEPSSIQCTIQQLQHVTYNIQHGATQSECQWLFPATAFEVISMVSRPTAPKVTMLITVESFKPWCPS